MRKRIKSNHRHYKQFDDAMTALEEKGVRIDFEGTRVMIYIGRERYELVALDNGEPMFTLPPTEDFAMVLP